MIDKVLIRRVASDRSSGGKKKKKKKYLYERARCK